ncbi:hypothetical protein [Halorussus marinus]|uniref:hypothetical protein n=1 Tax=Halorussus marinus TaxID=2505976 RepID=UPI00106E6634|nr:hypothetical protein [Halorussus marinus]
MILSNRPYRCGNVLPPLTPRLTASYDAIVTAPNFKLWEIMAVGHVVSTGLAAAISAVAPDDFRFEAIAQEGSGVAADGGPSASGSDGE